MTNPLPSADAKLVAAAAALDAQLVTAAATDDAAFTTAVGAGDLSAALQAWTRRAGSRTARQVLRDSQRRAEASAQTGAALLDPPTLPYERHPGFIASVEAEAIRLASVRGDALGQQTVAQGRA